MKKTISLIIFLCCCKALLAQEHHAYWLDKRYMQCWFKPPIDTICCPHKDLPDGKWFFYYDSAMTQLYRVCHRKKGLPIDFEFIYDKNNVLISLYIFRGGGFSHASRDYWENGTLHFVSYSHKGGILIAYDTLGNILRNSQAEATDETIAYVELFNKPFTIDTSVTGYVSLSDTIPVSKTFCIKDTINGFYYYQMQNVYNQVLNIYVDTNTCMIKKIEIAYKNGEPNLKCEHIENNAFILESGVKLGMTRKQLLEAKTYNFSIMTEEYVLYAVDKEGKMLYHNEYPFYKMFCEFKKDKVSRICIEKQL